MKRALHERFSSLLADTAGKELLEIGCGRSQLLPYFAREFGLRVSGLDYSPAGCSMARAILEREDVEGDIHLGDFLVPPTELARRFDVVVSFGVAEHFDDTAECIRAFAAFLKPGGLVVTVVPNTSGAASMAQRLLNRPVFDMHVPLNLSTLLEAHRRAGLIVERGEYVISSNFGICNLNGLPPRAPATLVKRVALAGLIATSVATWAVERWVVPIRPGPAFSPYILCAARRLP